MRFPVISSLADFRFVTGDKPLITFTKIDLPFIYGNNDFLKQYSTNTSVYSLSLLHLYFKVFAICHLYEI